MELTSLTIAQAHELLRSNEVSSEDLVKAFVARVEVIDGTLNAIVHRNFERALVGSQEDR